MNALEILVDSSTPAGAAQLVELERVIETLPVTTPREWAILALLCADQAGLAVVEQRRLAANLQRATDLGDQIAADAIAADARAARRRP